MKITFRGVRGSSPTPFKTHMKYGGNTSCVTLELDGRLLILDGGSGLAAFGIEFLNSETPFEGTLLLTHQHTDHICGIPFFAPLHRPDSLLSIFGGNAQKFGGLKHILSLQMSPPFFPLPFRKLSSNPSVTEFEPGESLDILPDVKITTFPLKHTVDTVGYRIEHKGKKLAYIVDTEHVEGKTDQHVLQLMEDADVVIYDTTYAEEEYPVKQGWGHSTWEEGARLCGLAKAKLFVPFHYSPEHTDDRIGSLAERMKGKFPRISPAREGETIIL